MTFCLTSQGEIRHEGSNLCVRPDHRQQEHLFYISLVLKFCGDKSGSYEKGLFRMNHLGKISDTFP